MIINDSVKLGSGGSNLVLETAGKVYIKVADRFYELDFKNQGTGGGRTISTSTPTEPPEVDLSQYVTKKYLRSTLTNYITTRGWEDIQETKEMLENALLDGFTESITPITVETMQLTVGTESLQFDFIDGLLTGNIQPAGFELMDDNTLRCPDNYIKHYTIGGPESVRPDTPIQYYSRWTIKYQPYSSDVSDGNTYLPLEDDNSSYYVYVRVPKYSASIDDAYVEAHLSDDPKGSGIGNFVLSSEAIELETLDDPGYYYFLTAIVTSKSNGCRSIGYMYGFTEIVPGQITAYIFKTADGTQYLDFLSEKFKIGDSDSGFDWNVTTADTLTVKGNMEVIGGPLRDELDELEGAITNDYLKKVIKDGRTTVQGGLLLSNVIALGHSTVDAQDPTYWQHFILESGISGICTSNKYSSDVGYYDVAAWFGGPMIDLENDSNLIVPKITIDTNPNKDCSRNTSSDTSISMYRWKITSASSETFYTKSTQPSVGDDMYYINQEELDFKGSVSASGPDQELVLRDEGNDRDITFTRWQGGNKVQDNILYYAWKSSSILYVTRYTTVFSVTATTPLYKKRSLIGNEIIPEDTLVIKTISQTGWYIKVNDDYLIRQGVNTSSFNFYAWKDSSDNNVFSQSLPPRINGKVWVNSTSSLALTSNKILHYTKGYANSVFRMNGSGYLSGGNISWDTEGNLTAKNITVQSGTIGGLLIDNNRIFNDSLNPTIEISSNSALLSNAVIHGSLSTRIEGSGMDNFIALSDADGSPIIRINGASLDTTAVPTFLYLDHGTSIWGGRVGQWWTYYHWNSEALVLKRVRAVRNGTLTIPQFSGHFWMFGQGMEPYGTLRFYVKSWQDHIPEQYDIINFGTFRGTNNHSFTVPTFTMDVESGKEYLLCLYSSGALESGFNIDTGFEISVDSSTLAYISYSDGSSNGLFMGANGINVNMAKNSCLTYLVPKITFSGGKFPSTDPRGNGGVFRLMLPSASGSTSENDAIGMEIQSYKDPSGTTTTPAFRINLGSGWKKLTTGSGTPLCLTD